MIKWQKQYNFKSLTNIKIVFIANDWYTTHQQDQQQQQQQKHL